LELLVKLGGIYNFLLVIFHLSFWKLFNWKDDLDSLSLLNRVIMPVLNISLTLLFVVMGLISLLHTEELLTTSLGKTLLLCMALFWLARSIQQVIFFKLKHPVSWAFLGYFLLGAVLYGIPSLYSLMSGN